MSDVNAYFDLLLKDYATCEKLLMPTWMTVGFKGSHAFAWLFNKIDANNQNLWFCTFSRTFIKAVFEVITIKTTYCKYTPLSFWITYTHTIFRCYSIYLLLWFFIPIYIVSIRQRIREKGWSSTCRKKIGYFAGLSEASMKFKGHCLRVFNEIYCHSDCWS